jgi:hypothetical protein
LTQKSIRRLFVPTKKTTAHRSPWSKEDVKELKAHSKARTPVAKIAQAMKRTEGALRRKAGILGIGVGHDRYLFGGGRNRASISAFRSWLSDGVFT